MDFYLFDTRDLTRAFLMGPRRLCRFSGNVATVLNRTECFAGRPAFVVCFFSASYNSHQLLAS